MKLIANCQWFEELLSAYIDNEIEEASRLQFEEHCNRCEECRRLLAQYSSLGELMRQSESSVNVEAMWERVSSALVGQELGTTSINSKSRSWGYSILAIAVSIALLWFVYRNDLSTEHHDHRSHDHAALAVDFQEVIQLAKSEPRAAISRLVTKYQGQELKQDEAIKYLGYEPALFKTVPAGYVRVSTHVLNMPCCKCSATICQRNDGTSLIVFEHKEEQAVWFGDSPAIETQCSGKSCKIVESAGQLAVSWKYGDRQLTLIGATDIAEVNQWVAQVKL